MVKIQTKLFVMVWKGARMHTHAYYLTYVQGFPVYIRKADTDEVVLSETAVISLTLNFNSISDTHGLQSNPYTWGQNRNITKLDIKMTST